MTTALAFLKEGGFCVKYVLLCGPDSNEKNMFTFLKNLVLFVFKLL